MSLVKLDKMDQPKARHKKNHPAKKDLGVGTTTENVVEVFLPANVPLMFERGQTFWIYLYLQIVGTKYSRDGAQFLGLKVKFKNFFSF